MALLQGCHRGASSPAPHSSPTRILSHPRRSLVTHSYEGERGTGMGCGCGSPVRNRARGTRPFFFLFFSTSYSRSFVFWLHLVGSPLSSLAFCLVVSCSSGRPIITRKHSTLLLHPAWCAGGMRFPGVGEEIGNLFFLSSSTRRLPPRSFTRRQGDTRPLSPSCRSWVV